MIHQSKNFDANMQHKNHQKRHGSQRESEAPQYQLSVGVGAALFLLLLPPWTAMLLNRDCQRVSLADRTRASQRENEEDKNLQNDCDNAGYNNS
jgi:hypothetical protein